METSRVAAFSDGVFAIAVTLLVLDLHVPYTGGGPPSLAYELRLEWPGYVGYVVSFATIGIMWINHHALMRHFDRADRPFLLINTGFLMLVAFVPFPTGVVASSLASPRIPDDVRTAALLYGGTMVVMALMFNAVWHYGRFRLLRADADQLEVSGITRSYIVRPADVPDRHPGGVPQPLSEPRAVRGHRRALRRVSLVVRADRADYLTASRRCLEYQVE